MVPPILVGTVCPSPPSRATPQKHDLVIQKVCVKC
uniref:Uncharacterized protein n=1 Tax=Anguilla anguilla TaxID=7936 RepID=A0A0E9PAG5_ANGAN